MPIQIIAFKLALSTTLFSIVGIALGSMLGTVSNRFALVFGCVFVLTIASWVLYILTLIWS